MRVRGLVKYRKNLGISVLEKPKGTVFMSGWRVKIFVTSGVIVMMPTYRKSTGWPPSSVLYIPATAY